MPRMPNRNRCRCGTASTQRFWAGWRTTEGYGHYLDFLRAATHDPTRIVTPRLFEIYWANIAKVPGSAWYLCGSRSERCPLRQLYNQLYIGVQQLANQAAELYPRPEQAGERYTWAQARGLKELPPLVRNRVLEAARAAWDSDEDGIQEVPRLRSGRVIAPAPAPSPSPLAEAATVAVLSFLANSPGVEAQGELLTQLSERSNQAPPPALTPATTPPPAPAPAPGPSTGLLPATLGTDENEAPPLISSPPGSPRWVLPSTLLDAEDEEDLVGYAD